MKFNRLAAVSAVLALTIGSVVGIGAAAFAVDVPIGDIGQEQPGGGYPAGQWFVGDPAGPALTQTTDGLTIPGRNQLLYGKTQPGVSGTAFRDLITGASFDGTGPITFQVPIFFDGSAFTGFTTLQPSTTGTPSVSTTWYSSRTAGGLTAWTPYTFDQIVAAIDASEGKAMVLAFGVYVSADTTGVLRSATWGGETWTFATPAAVVSPTDPATPAVPVQTSATFTG